MAANGKTAYGRAHALWTLEGMRAIDEVTIAKAVKDSSPDVRLAAIRTAEYLLKDNAKIAQLIHPLANDSDPDVVIQYSLSIAYAKLPDAESRIAKVVKNTKSEGVKALAAKAIEAAQDPKIKMMSEADQKFYKKGKGIYEQLCFSCHGNDGKGVKSPQGLMAPSFYKNKRISSHPDMPINVVLHGLTGPIAGEKYSGLMVPMKSNGDEWVAAVLSYIRNSFGNSASMISTSMVTDVRKATSERNTPWTMDELNKIIPQAISKKGWKIKASHNQENTKYITDGKLTPRWDTGTYMKPGMWLEVEFPQVHRINSIKLDSGHSLHDYPRGYEVKVSIDGKNWKTVIKGSSTSPVTDIHFSPEQAKFVKVILTKAYAKFWSIHEMDIFEKAK